MKLLISVCSIAMSLLVGYYTAPLGILWSFLLSSLGAILGIYIGWRLARHFGL